MTVFVVVVESRRVDGFETASYALFDTGSASVCWSVCGGKEGLSLPVRHNRYLRRSIARSGSGSGLIEDVRGSSGCSKQRER